MIDPWDERSGLPRPPIPVEQTFEGWLGLEWLELTRERARARVPVRKEFRQPLGLLHGGIYSAVAETVSSVATAAAVWPEVYSASGLSNSASFLRPVFDGTLDVDCRLRHAGELEWVWTVDFRDADGRLCATVEMTIAVRPRH